MVELSWHNGVAKSSPMATFLTETNRHSTSTKGDKPFHNSPLPCFASAFMFPDSAKQFVYLPAKANDFNFPGFARH